MHLDAHTYREYHLSQQGQELEQIQWRDPRTWSKRYCSKPSGSISCFHQLQDHSSQVLSCRVCRAHRSSTHLHILLLLLHSHLLNHLPLLVVAHSISALTDLTCSESPPLNQPTHSLILLSCSQVVLPRDHLDHLFLLVVVNFTQSLIRHPISASIRLLARVLTLRLPPPLLHSPLKPMTVCWLFHLHYQQILLHPFDQQSLHLPLIMLSYSNLTHFLCCWSFLQVQTTVHLSIQLRSQQPMLVCVLRYHLL